jgi:hypothetical protein
MCAEGTGLSLAVKVAGAYTMFEACPGGVLALTDEAGAGW